MSIKRLTDNEWASYQIGEAIRRHLNEGPRDRATMNTIETVFGWLQHWMEPGDLDAVSLLTGYLIDGPFENGKVPRFTDPVFPREKPVDLSGLEESFSPERPPERPSRPVRRPKLH